MASTENVKMLVTLDEAHKIAEDFAKSKGFTDVEFYREDFCYLFSFTDPETEKLPLVKQSGGNYGVEALVGWPEMIAVPLISDMPPFVTRDLHN